jgi:hypothetical protein
MKIAVCFSGQIRTGTDTAPNILRYIGDLLPECDFFVHTWDIEGASPNEGGGNGGHSPIDKEKISKFYSIYKPVAMTVEKFDLWPNRPRIMGIRKNPETQRWVVGMLESIYEVNQLKKYQEKKYNFVYDYVIRIRPDIIFNKDKNLRHDIGLVTGRNMITIAEHMTVNNQNRVEDIFWIAQSQTMDIIANFVNVRATTDWDIGYQGNNDNVPGHESIQEHLAQWLKTQNITWRELTDNRVEIYRPAGPLSFILETEGDHRRPK